MNNKSPGLTPVFSRLKQILSGYVPPLRVVSDSLTCYEVEFDKDYKVKSLRSGKTIVKHGMYFAGVAYRKGYVGFYFMPVYSHPDKFSDITDNLKKNLRGKSCFYVKQIEDNLSSRIEIMVRKGFKIYDKIKV